MTIRHSRCSCSIYMQDWSRYCRNAGSQQRNTASESSGLPAPYAIPNRSALWVNVLESGPSYCRKMAAAWSDGLRRAARASFQLLIAASEVNLLSLGTCQRCLHSAPRFGGWHQPVEPCASSGCYKRDSGSLERTTTPGYCREQKILFGWS